MHESEYLYPLVDRCNGSCCQKDVVLCIALNCIYLLCWDGGGGGCNCMSFSWTCVVQIAKKRIQFVIDLLFIS